MRRALLPSVACSATTVPPSNGFLSSNDVMSLTAGPGDAAFFASSAVPQA